jgi:putative tryptophan/tyrosine transport system substrate-binding protein
MAMPLTGLAQSRSAKKARIGFLEPLASTSGDYRAFLQGMRDLGYVEGSTFSVEARFAEGRLERLPVLASELAASRVDVIVTQSTPGVAAARQANPGTPIVMVAIGDPVGSGFVKSLARPEGNITGLSNLATEVAPKLLEMLKEVVPGLSRIAVLGNPRNPQNAAALGNFEASAQKLGVKIVPVSASTPGEIDSLFDSLARQRPDAMVVLGDPFLRLQAARIAGLALRHKLPLASSSRISVESSGLLSYEPSFADLYRRAAGYVDRILKGAKPADLPVEQPTKLILVLNRKTAKALGLAIPHSLLISADEVID